MVRRKNSQYGAISVFVSLMMAGILSLGTLVLEAGRYQAAKNQLSEAMGSAANSMLASYNATLYDRYGLLAMDEDSSTPAACRDYLAFNSDLSAGYFGNNVTRLYALDEVKMTGVYNLTYPDILRRQLLTMAKYNIVPENSQLNVYTAQYVLSELQAKCDHVVQLLQAFPAGGAASAVNAPMKEALVALENTFKATKKYEEEHGVTLTAATKALLPSTTGTAASPIPQTDKDLVQAYQMDAVDLLGTTGQALATQTEVQTVEDVSVSVRDLSDSRTAGWATAFADADRAAYLKSLANGIRQAVGLVDIDGNLLLNTYIAQIFANRNQTVAAYAGPGETCTESGTDNMTFSAACCEYVFGGNVSETKNQSAAYDYITAVRLISNLDQVIQESTSLDKTNRYSVAAHIAWAYYETCVDLELLTTYGVAVPLNKDHLILPINQPAKVTGAFAGKNAKNALAALGYYDEATKTYVIAGGDVLNYTDSLALALWLVPNSDKLLRVADLIQLEMRYRQAHIQGVTADFLMKDQNTFCRVACTAQMNTILPILSPAGEHTLQGHSFGNVKYAGY